MELVFSQQHNGNTPVPYFDNIHIEIHPRMDGNRKSLRIRWMICLVNYYGLLWITMDYYGLPLSITLFFLEPINGNGRGLGHDWVGESQVHQLYGFGVPQIGGFFGPEGWFIRTCDLVISSLVGGLKYIFYSYPTWEDPIGIAFGIRSSCQPMVFRSGTTTTIRWFIFVLWYGLVVQNSIGRCCL